jgi:hypothetical protein
MTLAHQQLKLFVVLVYCFAQSKNRKENILYFSLYLPFTFFFLSPEDVSDNGLMRFLKQGTKVMVVSI